VLFDFVRDGIARIGHPEQRSEVECFLLSQPAARETWPAGANHRQRPGGGFRLRAAYCAASTAPAMRVYGKMPAQAAGLIVPPSQEFPSHHDGSADSCSQRDHHDIALSAGCAGTALAEQSHARIVLNTETNSELGTGPGAEIEFRRILVFFVCRKDASGVEIREPAKS
jgi:hypothetical protein